MKQIWHDLLFAHWPLPSAVLRPLVPAPLALDTFNGACWIGVVPFRMSGVRGRGLPLLPGLSRFPELNVRTYVTYGGKPGVYFFSLDAANRPAVWAARAFFHLPYFHAAMTSEERNEMIHYSCHRRGASAEFRGRYRPIACLYTVHDGAVHRGEIHHQPWPLQNAEADLE